MNNRNNSIDLLRIFTMTLVTCIHFLCYNELWVNNDMPTYNRVFCDVLITLTYCFVNIFVLMSGYLLGTKSFDVRRILNTWSLVWVTCMIAAIGALCINPVEFSINGALRSAFPVLTASYWYIVTYFFLLLVAPLINKILDSYDENRIRKTLVLIGFVVLVFMNFNPLVNTTTFLGSDSSLLWFCYMYAIGSNIRRNGMKHWNLIRILGVLSFVILFTVKFFGLSLPGGIEVLSTSSVLSVLLSLFIFGLFVRHECNLQNHKMLMGGGNLAWEMQPLCLHYTRKLLLP